MYLYRLAPCKFSAFVRIAIQMSLLSYWYPDTFEFNRVFPNLDHLFATAEQWMFGGQPAVWFCHAFPQMWVSEPFNMGYFAYYPMILVVTLFYFIYRFDLFEKMSFVLVTCFSSTTLFIYSFRLPALSSISLPSAWIRFAGCLSFHWRLFQSQSGVASRTRLSAWILLQPGGGLTASRRTSDCRFSQFACGRVDHSDDYGMACQQETVCLPDAVLSVALWSYCLHSGTLSD